MQYTNIIWRDGQPYSEMFDDIYYASNEGEDISGESEFRHVFFNNNGLPQRWQTDENFVIAELGFGSGLNCLLTIREWLKHLSNTKQNKTLHYIAIEKYPLAPQTIVELISRYPELKSYCDELVKNYPPAVETSHSRRLFSGKVIIHFKFMDVIDALKDGGLNVDAWYLDGFSPANNTAMWSEDVFLALAGNSRNNATCSTYTAAGYVRRNLIDAGFTVRKVPGYGKKREMLIASYAGSEEKLLNYNNRPWFHAPVQPAIKNKKAIVIGAGISGLTAAAALVKRGCSVTILDSHGAIAKETSSNPVALVYPRLAINNKVDTDFYIAAFCHALYVLTTLQSEKKEQFWFESGLQQLMDSKKFSSINEQFQFDEAWFSISEASADNIGLKAAGQVLVDIKKAGFVLPDILCKAIVAECGDSLTIKKAKVDLIEQVDGGWKCFADTQLIDEAEVLIIANGVSVGHLQGLMSFPIESVRGQVVALHAKPLSDNIKSCFNTGVYLTPLVNSRHYLGATYTRENVKPIADINDTRLLISKLRDNAVGVVADVFVDQSENVESWVGFRAMSVDRVPIVGAVPEVNFYQKEYKDIRHGNVKKTYHAGRHVSGLYITAGHGSRGFTSSFLSAEIIAAQVFGGPLPVAKGISDYLSPSRFIVNKLKRR